MDELVATNEIWDFVDKHIGDDVAALGLAGGKKFGLDDDEMRFALVQIEARQKLGRKLGRMTARRGVIFPQRLSWEQCSSEATAAYKFREIAKLVDGSFDCGVDLTGGLGVDAMAMADVCKTVDYVEMNDELCKVAEVNFHLMGYDNIKIHNMTAEAFVDKCVQGGRKFDLIYLDPARRGANGEKVYRLEECSPDVRAMCGSLQKIGDLVMVKMSPLISVSDCRISDKGGLQNVLCIGTDGECKEVVTVEYLNPVKIEHDLLKIKCVEIERSGKYAEFEFMDSDERKLLWDVLGFDGLRNMKWIYEPSPVMMKTCGWRTIARQYGVKMIGMNAHLYASSYEIKNFPGRRFKMTNVLEFNRKDIAKMFGEIGGKANITVRNFKMSVEDIRKKFRVRDGGDKYLFFCTDDDGRKIVILC